VQNLFCEGFRCKIYFAKAFVAKFILRRLSLQNLFCEGFRCKIYFAKAKIDNDTFLNSLNDMNFPPPFFKKIIKNLKG